MNKKEIIGKIVKEIKTRYQPQKIILFGSYGRGETTEDSDIDLFLIMESNLRRDERAREVLKIFSDRTFPIDIIVYTPKEVEQSLKRGNPFVREILGKGQVLYG
ncbi:MAG: nucleotidyltransferase domain-containing protein [Armatimonadetes bacterium CG07_land_8_20_14_0_80_40_9]|nr:MAG: nucleotidyltransferase domain-containing protein [Armatimonadetes bacterium CG07_land_8_20_14_0_80_40_9]